MACSRRGSRFARPALLKPGTLARPRKRRLTKYGTQTILSNAVASVVEGDFEWDPDKAQWNLEKHGVSFAEAATVFADLLPSTSMTGPVPTGWSLSELRYGIVCFSSSMSSEANAIASSARDQLLVPSETFTNPETIHDPVS